MTPVRKMVLMLTLFALAAFSACADIAKLGKEFDPSQRTEDRAYEKAITPYLVKGSVYHGPATKIIFKTLSLTDPVRMAMAIRQGQAFDSEPQKIEKLMADQKIAGSRVYEIALSAFVPNRKWNDLASEHPDFKLFLENKRGQRLLPLDIRRIKERNPLNEALYPFWGPWDRLYRISFSKKLANKEPFLLPNENKARLIMTGPAGLDEISLILK